MRFDLMLGVSTKGTPQVASELYQNEIGQIVLAEQLGYDCVWVAEHHFTTYVLLPAPLLLLVAAAQHTRTIRLGTAVLPLPFYHPLRVAEDVAMADHLTGGRLNVGIGRGYQPYEFSPLGTEFEESIDRFEEILEIMRLAWSGEEFSYKGQYYQVPGPLTVTPTPRQQPHPPLWLASSTPRSIAISARRGFYPISTAGIHDPRELEEARKAYHRTLEELGRDPQGAPLAVQRVVHVAPDRSRLDEFIDAALWIYRCSVRYASQQERPPRHGLADASPNEGEPSREELISRMIIGTPDEVAERIAGLRELGVTRVICAMEQPGLPLELVHRSMRLFAEEVMPRFVAEREPEPLAV